MAESLEYVEGFASTATQKAEEAAASAKTAAEAKEAAAASARTQNTQAGISNVQNMYLNVGTIFHANKRQMLFESLFHRLWTPFLPV